MYELKMGHITGVRSAAKEGFPITTIPALGPIQQRIQWVDVALQSASDHARLFTVCINNSRSYASTVSQVFAAGCLFKSKSNFATYALKKDFGRV